MGLQLGIDSGGSRTRAVLADANGHELARAEGASVKLLRVAQPEAEQRLDALLIQLQAAADRSLRDVTSTCAGISGYGAEWLRHAFTAMLRARVSGRLHVCGDEETALAAARNSQQPAAPVILLIAGTGSHCTGISAGASAHAGGWGPALGDEGGGSWIGRYALRCALHRYDNEGRRSRGVLLQSLMDFWGAVTLEQLVSLAHQPDADFASLVPAVAAAEEAGDPTAQNVLRRAGKELARIAVTVTRELRLEEATICWTGSILRQMPAVREAVKYALRDELFTSYDLAAEETDPLKGALLLAAEE